MIRSGRFHLATEGDARSVYKPGPPGYMFSMSSAQGPRTYKIGQAAEALGLKPYVLRFWESEFEQLDPIRTPSGQRLYTEEHLGLVRRIKHLLYDEGMTLEGARKRLRESEQSDFLRSVYGELLEIRKMLD